MRHHAVFSPCRTWRYVLERSWADMFTPEHEKHRAVMFVALNPSTADEVQNDPTVRRMIGYAQRWGFQRLVVANIFAYRSTDPKVLYDQEDPVGPENDDWIARHAGMSERVVGAWGNHGAHRGRGKQVLALLREIAPVYALGVNSSGHPVHPLYQRLDQPLQEIR